MKIINLIIFTLFAACSINEPVIEPPLDNRYNLKSALQKLQKTHPETKQAKHIQGLQIWPNQVYKRIGSRELKLDIYRLKQTEHRLLPAIVLVHGGGWSSGNRKMWYALAERLASFGYVTASVSYRLSPEAGFPAAIHDVRDAVFWLRQNADRFGVNSNFIALAGGSAGGQIASLVGFSSGDPALDKLANKGTAYSKVQAIINIDGLSSFVTDLALKYENDRPQPSPVGKWLGGSFEQTPNAWHQASPVNYVKHDSPPILIIRGKQPRFTAGLDELKQKLNTYKITNYIEDNPTAPHSFWLFDPWVEPTAKRIDTFLKTLTSTKP